MTDLPAQYRHAHNYCYYLHDQMVALLKHLDGPGRLTVEVDLRDDETPEDLEDLGGGGVLEWLEKTDRVPQLARAYLNHTFPSLLADLLHFVYEALSCSSKGKLTVAYALLRKPFKENLLMLEWMVAGNEEFLTALHTGNIDAMSIRGLTSDQGRTKSIIARSAKTTLTYGGDESAEFLWRLRFDKTCEYGFEQLWQQASHLVTTRGPIRTEAQNLNFIFSDGDSLASQWEHLYGRLPVLLGYCLELSEVLYQALSGNSWPQDAGEVIRRAAGSLCWTFGLLPGSASHPSVPTAESLDVLSFTCPGCSHPNPGTADHAVSFWLQARSTCTCCKRQVHAKTVMEGLVARGIEDPRECTE